MLVGLASTICLGGLCIAAARTPNGAALGSKCPSGNPPDADGWQPVPKNAKPACLREIASRQVAGTVIQQDFVPSVETGCESDPVHHPRTTQISVTAYQHVDKLPYDRYTKKEGYIVARIDNSSNCTTRHINLKTGHSYLLVIEGKGTKGRLVDLATGDPIGLSKFISCTNDTPPAPPANPETPLNVAFLRSLGKRCNHDPFPEGLMKALFSTSADAYLGNTAKVLNARKLVVDDPWVIWISCGTDCCFADS